MAFYILKEDIEKKLACFLKEKYPADFFAESIKADFCHDRPDYEIEGRYTKEGKPVLIKIARLASLPELYTHMGRNHYPAQEAITAIEEQVDYLGVEL